MKKYFKRNPNTIKRDREEVKKQGLLPDKSIYLEFSIKLLQILNITILPYYREHIGEFYKEDLDEFHNPYEKPL